MNPVTGRSYSLSWKFAEVYASAIDLYRDLEQVSGKRILDPVRIVRVLPDPRSIDNWSLRCADPRYRTYMQEAQPATDWPQFRQADTVGVIEPLFRVRVTDALGTIRELVGSPEIGTLQPGRRIKTVGEVLDIPLDQQLLVACGYRMREALDFPLPLAPYKGEALIIHSKELPEDTILHHRLKIVPWGEGRFWVGAESTHDFTDAAPTTRGRRNLEEQLRATFSITYTVLEHRAGVRPASRQRRPFLRPLPEGNGWLLNGLGTKGASLAPWMTDLLVRHLLEGEELPGAVDLRTWKTQE